MYFVPLSQLESVELVIHGLRAAGGAAGCEQCPAYRVCTKQCLTIAAAVERLLQLGTLPQLEGQAGRPLEGSAQESPDRPTGGGTAGKGRFKVVK